MSVEDILKAFGVVGKTIQQVADLLEISAGKVQRAVRVTDRSVLSIVGYAKTGKRGRPAAIYAVKA